MNEIENTPTYLLEYDASAYKKQAEMALKRTKEMDAKKSLIPVWQDERTIRLVDMEKIKKRKMEIIKVKIGKGELVFMEKEIAIKNGFITE